jgi:hypothetical protein
LSDDRVTVLTCTNPANPATKKFSWIDGQWQKRDYNAGTFFRVSSYPVRDVRSLANVVEHVRRDSHSLIIRGELAPHVDVNNEVRRTIYAPGSRENGCFVNVPRQWLMIDIDGFRLPPDLSPDSAIEAAIETLLPAEFHGVTTFWQLSSSSGIKPGLRCHLWFWADRPVENKLLRSWIDEIKRANLAKGHGKNPDPALFNPVQIHYVADPIFEGAPDPVAQRTDWLVGDRDSVTLSELNIASLNECRKANAVASGLSPSQATTVEAALELMGDDDGLDGFNAPIVAAGWAYARATPPWQRDKEIIKARIRNAVLGAPRGDGRTRAEIERYRSDAYLDPVLQGAFDKNPEARGWTSCLPTFPMPTETVEQARETMRTAIRDFMANGYSGAKPRQGLITSELGLGKTEEVLQALGDTIAQLKAAGRPWRVILAIPEHALGGEIVNRARRLGIKAATWRSRHYEPPDGSKMCDDLPSVQLAEAAKARVDTAVCKKDEHQCEFYETCQYQRQKAQCMDADLVVVASKLLTSPPVKELSHDLAMVILDESFTKVGLDATAIKVETLSTDITRIENQPCFRSETDSLGGVRRQFPDQKATRELAALHAEFPKTFDGYLTREIMETTQLATADCRSGAGLELKRMRDVQMHPGMPRKRRKEIAKACVLNDQVLKLSALFEATAELMESGDEATGRVELATDRMSDGDCAVFKLNLLHKLNEDYLKVPVLCLDRTANIEMLRYYLPDVELLASGTPVTPHVVVNQIPSKEFSKTNLEKRPELVKEIVDFVLLNSGGESTLVVTHASIEHHFEGHAHIRSLHFGAVAGKDGHGDVRHIFVIGMAQPDPEDARRYASCLTGKPVPSETWSRVTAGILMADRSGVELKVSQFEHPELEMVRAAVADASIVQAFGRARAVNRTADTLLTAWVLSRCILPWPVDNLELWGDAALSPVMRMLARGMAFESPGDAHLVFPDLFRTPAAAKMAFMREREVNKADLGNSALMRSIHKGFVTEIGYQVGGQGRRKNVLHCTNEALNGLEQRLTDALGPLAYLTVGKDRIPTEAPCEEARPAAAIIIGDLVATAAPQVTLAGQQGTPIPSARSGRTDKVFFIKPPVTGPGDDLHNPGNVPLKRPEMQFVRANNPLKC